MSRAHAGVFIFLLFCAMAPAAFASDPNADAGRELERMEDKEKAGETDARLKSQEKIPSVEIMNAKTPDTAAGGSRFGVKRIHIEGNTVFSEDTLRKTISSWENRDLTLDEIRRAAETITQYYLAAGYITCRAYIPPQKLTDGTVTIRILEGKLGEVRVRGGHPAARKNIESFFSASKNKVIEYSKLLKGLSRAGLHPDRSVKAVVAPGDTLGTSDLALDIEDRFPLHLGAEINNYGTRLTGRERYNLSLRHTNLFGWDDIFAGRLQAGEEVFAGGLQTLLPVGDGLTKIGGTVNYTEVGVGQEFQDLNIEGTAFAWSLLAQRTLAETDPADFTLTGSFESKSVDNTTLNISVSRDELRLFHAGLDIDERDNLGRSFVTNDFVFGVSAFGASEKNSDRLSRSGSGAPFFIYRGNATRLHPVTGWLLLRMQISGQWTSDGLVSSEQYDIGGIYTVRGYPQNDYLADSGAGGNLEAQIPFFLFPDKIKLVAFFDGAYGKLNRPAAGENVSKTNFGAGGGMRFELPGNWRGSFVWAAPFGNDTTDTKTSQFYFSVSCDFF